MHQQVDFPLSSLKSYPLLNGKRKFFCQGINHLGSILSKPLIPTARSLSWEINCIERKRSSSLVSSLLLQTKFNLFYTFFLTNSYCHLPFHLFCKSHHYYCNYVSLVGIIQSFSIKKRTEDSVFIIIIMFACHYYYQPFVD